MRIIFNVPDLLSGKGGAERVAVELANRLSALGHTIALLCIARDNPPSYSVDNGVRILTTPSMNNPRGQRVALEKCREFEPTAYFFFYSNGKIVEQYVIGKRLGVSMGAQECTNPLRCIRNIANDLELTVEEATTLRTAILADLNAIRMTMDHYADSVPRFVRKNVFSFKNSFPNIRPVTPALSDDKHWFINVSGLGKKNKNGLALIRALPLVVARHKNWGVLFVGSASNHKRAMELAESLGVAEHVNIVESVDDINPYYSSAAFHVICSFEEGCPNAVCEAMIHGLPSIGYEDCEGTKQLIVNEKNGLLVSRSVNEVELGAAICRLIEDENLRQQLGLEAQSTAINDFNPDRVYEKWLTLFAHIVVAVKEPRSQQQLEFAYFLGHFLSTYFAEENKHFVPTEAPDVDFIVPLYNKRAEIGRTMQSILASDYPAYRIIVVDDQSTDGSYELIQQEYGSHPKVQIVRREKNGGLSAARNTGLSLSHATFIQFWDADDIYYGDALSYLVKTAVIGNSDIVTGLAERNGAILPAYQLSQLDCFALKKPFCHLAFHTMSTCFKLYRREFLVKNGLHFIEGLYMQDTELNLRAFALANSVSMANVVIGDYVDTGANRGSQHVSDLRMNSALEIFDHNRAADTNNASVPRAYADFIILKFVFRFFVSRLLRPDQFERVFDANIDRVYYLERFRERINQMTPGIHRLFDSSEKNDWRLAMVFGFMQMGDDEMALRAIKISDPDQIWFEQAAKCLAEHLELNQGEVFNRIQMVANN